MTGYLEALKETVRVLTAFEHFRGLARIPPPPLLSPVSLALPFLRPLAFKLPFIPGNLHSVT